jgi:hypothetical protein
MAVVVCKKYAACSLLLYCRVSPWMMLTGGSFNPKHTYDVNQDKVSVTSIIFLFFFIFLLLTVTLIEKV